MRYLHPEEHRTRRQLLEMLFISRLGSLFPRERLCFLVLCLLHISFKCSTLTSGKAQGVTHGRKHFYLHQASQDDSLSSIFICKSLKLHWPQHNFIFLLYPPSALAGFKNQGDFETGETFFEAPCPFMTAGFHKC